MTTNTLTGEYFYNIDSKGRLNIPAKYRNALAPENNNTFIITKGQDPCIYAYPLIEWGKVESELRNLSSASLKNRSFIRTMVRFAVPVKFDKQGRIQLTPALMEYASLDKEVLIIGVVNKIEIWNPIKLDQLEKNELKIDSQEYETLAEKIIL
jgi:MraZ protein|tara:strand:- start:15529 stop:15987 length:459 start_codon:yes stop_codon:yes gene_type:complete